MRSLSKRKNERMENERKGKKKKKKKEKKPLGGRGARGGAGYDISTMDHAFVSFLQVVLCLELNSWIV